MALGMWWVSIIPIWHGSISVPYTWGSGIGLTGDNSSNVCVRWPLFPRSTGGCQEGLLWCQCPTATWKHLPLPWCSLTCHWTMPPLGEVEEWDPSLGMDREAGRERGRSHLTHSTRQPVEAGTAKQGLKEFWSLRNEHEGGFYEGSRKTHSWQRASDEVATVWAKEGNRACKMATPVLKKASVNLLYV